jgi:acetyl esterase/lipase
VAQDNNTKLFPTSPYYAEEVRRQDSYIGERCLLDIYYPVNKKDFTTVVWFHGGGLTRRQ